MSTVYGLAIVLTFQLPEGTGRGAEDLRRAAPDGDRMTRLIESRPSAEYFGRFWSGQVERGVAVLFCGRRVHGCGLGSCGSGPSLGGDAPFLSAL